MKISSYFLQLVSILTISMSACVHQASSPNKGDNGQNLVSAEIYEGFKESEVNEVLILPLLLRSNIDGVLDSPEDVLGLPDKIATELLVNAFDVNTNLNLLDSSSPMFKSTDYWSLLNKNGLTKEGLFKRSGEISKSLGVNHVIFCILDDKDMRTGGGYGSERSSSLSYRIWLYESKTDKIIWSSAYQSKQDSITSNLFEFGQRLESGIGFKTSEELMKIAFKNSALRLNRDLLKKNLKK